MSAPGARRAERVMTDQELHDYAADHISYELTMLHETAQRLQYRARQLDEAGWYGYCQDWGP